MSKMILDLGLETVNNKMNTDKKCSQWCNGSMDLVVESVPTGNVEVYWICRKCGRVDDMIIAEYDS